MDALVRMGRWNPAGSMEDCVPPACPKPRANATLPPATGTGKGATIKLAAKGGGNLKGMIKGLGLGGSAARGRGLGASRGARGKGRGARGGGRGSVALEGGRGRGGRGVQRRLVTDSLGRPV